MNTYDLSSLIEVKLRKTDNFLLVKETLTRIGVLSKQKNALFQSCHILHKQGKFYIVHFKELFILDGKASTIDENDIKRRNTIAKLLEEWELVDIVNPEVIDECSPMSQIKVVPYSEKEYYELVPKYTIGKYKSKPFNN
jgi:hypothetical protein